MAALGTDTKLKVLKLCLDALEEFQISYKGMSTADLGPNTLHSI